MIYIKEIIDHKIGDNTPSRAVARSLGWTITREESEIETGYDGSKYELGHAPVEPEKTYTELRVAEYPAIAEQLDMIYHDFDNWKAVIAEIKAKYPKE